MRSCYLNKKGETKICKLEEFTQLEVHVQEYILEWITLVTIILTKEPDGLDDFLPIYSLNMADVVFGENIDVNLKARLFPVLYSFLLLLFTSFKIVSNNSHGVHREPISFVDEHFDPVMEGLEEFYLGIGKSSIKDIEALVKDWQRKISYADSEILAFWNFFLEYNLCFKLNFGEFWISPLFNYC